MTDCEWYKYNLSFFNWKKLFYLIIFGILVVYFLNWIVLVVVYLLSWLFNGSGKMGVSVKTYDGYDKM